MIVVTRITKADSSFFIIDSTYYGCMVAFKDARYLCVGLVGFFMRAIHGLAAYGAYAQRMVVRDQCFIAHPCRFRFLLNYLFDCLHVRPSC